MSLTGAAALLLLLQMGGVGPARGETAQAPPSALRYVTLNLLHGGLSSGLTGNDQHLDRRLDIVSEELRGLGADIIGLQEASTGRARGNVAARLAARLGFHWVYGTTVNPLIAALINFSEGPAILSRFPIAVQETHDLPLCGRLVDPRMLIFARIQTPWGTLPVFSTHTSGDPCHTRRVVELVRARRGALPAVLMGDFNAVEGSPAIRLLTEEAGFLDVFRVANPTAPGQTVWQRIEAPEPTVRRRVDYLFLVPGTEATGTIVESHVILNAPRRFPDGTVLWPSDHYGVLAELAVFPGSTASASGHDDRD